MKLTDSTRQFILHWGEMGTRWGVNRTGRPGARAALSLTRTPHRGGYRRNPLRRALQRQHQPQGTAELEPGRDRQPHRRPSRLLPHFRRRVDALPHRCRATCRTRDHTHAHHAPALRRRRPRPSTPPQPAITERITAMQVFLEELHGWYSQIKKSATASLRSLIRIGNGITRILPKARSGGCDWSLRF